MHQASHIRRCRNIIDHYAALTSIVTRDFLNGGIVSVVRERILEFEHRIADFEELNRRICSRIEHHFLHSRGKFGVYVRRRLLVILIDIARRVVTNFVEEDAADRDVGLGVGCPTAIDINF